MYTKEELSKAYEMFKDIKHIELGSPEVAINAYRAVTRTNEALKDARGKSEDIK